MSVKRSILDKITKEMTETEFKSLKQLNDAPNGLDASISNHLCLALFDLLYEKTPVAEITK